ncbi:E3 ubiquitin-protein ligase TRIM35-like isoform X2 [Garra rufa]|uniref:E3 ubiquitin-protein ligase TRIM35-like isoform X2 n=1 Tax=Garra rufa TaxID=137080 RepID=UPI003CCEB66B
MEVSALDDPPLNLALKNLCETFQQERSQSSSSGGENVCSAHNEKLKLFCLDDQQAVCLVCRDSKLHTDHSFCPINEAVNNNKDKLKAVLVQLREKMGIFDNFKQTLDQTADRNKVQTQETEEKINKEFEELREILRNEAVARITVLREEERQKSQMIKDKTKKTSEQIISLKCAFRDIQQQMKAEDDSFLQNFKSTLERAQLSLPGDTGDVSDLLIYPKEYLEDLRLTVLQKIDSSREDPSSRGGHNLKRGHRGGPTVRGDPNSRGGFRGDPNSRGGHGNRNDPNFKENPNFRGGLNLKQGPGNRGAPNFKENPIFRGGHNLKQGPGNRGAPNFNENPILRGDNNLKQGPGNRGDPSFNEEPFFRGEQHFRGNSNFRGDNRGHMTGETHGYRGGRNYRGAHYNEGTKVPEWVEEFHGSP